MSWGMVAVAGASLVGGALSSRAAGKAAGQQEESLERAISEIREDFGITEQEFMPFRQAAVGGPGVAGALERQQQFLGLRGPEAQRAAFEGFIESPGQAFLRQRGEQALVRQASAIGGLGGGNIRQALQEQGIGVAAQQQGELQNRLAGLTGLGFQATTGLGRERSRKAENIAELMTAQGQAAASGTMGRTSGILGGIGGAAKAIGFSDERVKTDIHDLDLEDCYKAVMTLPLKSWRYLESMGLGTETHFGPLAQEAPDCIRAGQIDGIEALDIHDELMLIAGALQYMQKEGLLRIEKCH